MEGIQHRLDCPARKHLDAAAAEVVTITGTTEYRRCRYCQRSAFIQHQPPEETSDEQ
jgi:hypothetical protein